LTAPKVIAIVPSFSAGVIVRASFVGSTSTEFFEGNVFGVKALEAVSHIETAPKTANNVPGAAFLMRSFAEFQVPRVSLGGIFTRLISSL
jgi:hypothetical protein